MLKRAHKKAKTSNQQQFQSELIELKVEVHSLEQKLAESRGGEAALRSVIAENVLHLRQREM